MFLLEYDILKNIYEFDHFIFKYCTYTVWFILEHNISLIIIIFSVPIWIHFKKIHLINNLFFTIIVLLFLQYEKNK